MACELFIPWKPHVATLTVVEQANAIIAEYLDQNFALTLRQLFYQTVARVGAAMSKRHREAATAAIALLVERFPKCFAIKHRIT